MKRTFLLLSALAVVCLVAALSATKAQQTQTDEVAIIQLPVPTNVIGTFVRGVSSDGKRVIFDSINDYNGNNVDSNTEIWVYDVDSRAIIQVTDTSDIKDPADTTKILTKINNLSPVISGDGTKIAFISNASFGDEKNDNGNYEIWRADIPRGATKATLSRMTNTGKNTDDEVIKEKATNYDPTINDDGSLIGFVSTRRAFNPITGGAAAFTALKEGPNNLDPDGNGEIFLYNVNQRQYSQVTVSRDEDATSNFIVKGFNSRPALSGNGKSMVFLSGFNYPGANANNNADFNGEIFLYKVGDTANSFTQVTVTNGNTGSTSDLPAIPSNGVVNVMAAYTRPLSADGSLLVFESSGNLAGKNADSANRRTREIYIADLRGAKPVFTQITDQPPAEADKTDFNFFPSINSAGTFITFITTQNITPTSPSAVKTDNADGSKEVFRYDIANAKFRQFTFGPVNALLIDQRGNSYSPYPDNSGNLVTFSVSAALLAPNSTTVDDLFQALILPVTSKNATEAKLANAASFDATQVARGSIVAAFGTQLSNSTMSAASVNLPFNLGGVTVTVNGLAARLIFVSSGQVNFVMPGGVGNGDTVDFTINNNGVLSSGKVKIVDASPGVFTTTADGQGRAAAQCGKISPDGMSFLVTLPPCNVGNESQFDVLTIYGTGWRNTTAVQVKIGDQTLTPSYVGPQPDFPGLDQINVSLVKDLADKADQDISVVIAGATTTESNKSKVSFLPFESSITTINAASFDTGVVAPGSSAAVQGTELANSTATGPPGPVIEGVSVSVAGLPAILTSVSPTQVNFVVPDAVKPFDLVEVRLNNNGKISRGRVKVAQVAPGVFTTTNDGAGRAQAKCGKPNSDGTVTFTDPPCSVGTEASPNILRIFGTGWRKAEKVTLKVGDSDLETISFGAQPNAFGIDIVDVKLVPALAGKTDVDVIVTATVGTAGTVTKAGIKISFNP